jgi:hypothetical protein
MEYVDGEDLAERIGQGPMAPEEAARIAIEICGFLEKAHQFEATLDDRRIRGIIHGDIKPKNVRLNRAGDVKVLDFGIAKGLALSRKLTRNDFGSLSYLSPERLDTGEVDPHVDFWSVGVLLYEMIAGSAPYQADTSQALESLIRSRQPPAPLPEACPPALARIILKMLAGPPSRRYADAGLIRHDLDAFRRGEPTVADAEWMALQPDGEMRPTAPAFAIAAANSAAIEADATRRSDVAVVGAIEADATRRSDVAVVGAIEADATRRSDVAVLDDEATRRTVDVADVARGFRPVNGDADSEATRRTIDAPPVAMPSIPPPAPPPGVAPASTRVAPYSRWVVALVLLTVIGLVVNEVSVWTAARRIRVGLATGQTSEMQGLWDEYQGLAHRSLFGIGLVGVKSAMKERLLSQAERVISDYRQDAPTVREAQWRQAATWLTDILNLDPGDRATAARLRYCEGHLRRIDGETRKRKKLSSAEAFHDAIARFEEAGRVDARWPDPFLGLARTYIYGLDDLDRAIGALKEAERRGYRPGNRELVQMADGYRSRAERWRREAATVRGLEQERECLQKSADDFRQALDLYQKAIGFGEASSGVRAIQSRLDEVQKKLDQENAPKNGPEDVAK